MEFMTHQDWRVSLSLWLMRIAFEGPWPGILYRIEVPSKPVKIEALTGSKIIPIPLEKETIVAAFSPNVHFTNNCCNMLSH